MRKPVYEIDEIMEMMEKAKLLGYKYVTLEPDFDGAEKASYLFVSAFDTDTDEKGRIALYGTELGELWEVDIQISMTD